jgi:hypothetical protein
MFNQILSLFTGNRRPRSSGGGEDAPCVFGILLHLDIVDTKSLVELEQAQHRFHQYHIIFVESSVCKGLNVP